MDKVNVGLIGSGSVSELHAEAFGLVKDAEVVAVASPTESRVREFATKWKIPKWFTDYHHMLEMEDIDVVCLGIPNYLHCQVTVDAAKAGKHVICEKPLCLTLEEADLMINTCKENSVKLMYAETLCFVPKYRKVKELIDGGAVGKVYLVKQCEKHFGPHSDWFWDVEKAGGGCLVDTGCHGIEFCRWILGKPKVRSVYAQLDQLYHKDKGLGEDNVLLLLEFEDGALGLVENSSVKRGGMDDRAEVFGFDGYIHANLLMGNAIHAYSEYGYSVYAEEKMPPTRGWTWVYWAAALQYGFHEEMRHFIRCVKDDEQPLETGEDGKAVLEIIYAAYESARTAKKVYLPFQPERRVAKPIDLWLQGRDL